MRVTALAGCLALLVACAPAERQEEPAPPAGPSLADFAGTWNTTTMLVGVEAPVESQMIGTADGVWSMVLPGRDPVPLQVSVVGDSLIATSGEYESVVRPGVMVSVRVASVLHGDMLMGNLTATYRTAAGEEVVTGTTQSARAPM